MSDDYDEQPRKSDGTSCGDIRMDLKECVMNSDCVAVRKMKPKDCLLNHESDVPELCFNLRTLLFECKRSLLDNRVRFRGRKGTV